ncbi:SDR family oxidoreductase [Yinghuangia aomiensis]|uniref:SDR family oxidoreductase n=1 Tax=Yinghuangia aomiensis TaxID=676205 RepID=A0ABP9GTU5_9ACTN
MITDRLRLDGRTVIVSGAGGGGIGTSCAAALAEAGATIVAVDRDAQRLADLPDTYVKVEADIFTAEGVQSVVDAAPAPLHGLVNVVGGSLPPHWAPALDYARDQWDSSLDLNLHHVMFLSQAVARKLVEQNTGGSITTIASTGGVVAAPFHVAYGTAKAAVLGLTRTLALEWGQYGIRVNAVAAGSITTPRATKTVQDPALSKRGVPLGRRGTPDDIAAAVLFLISDLSAYTTGAVLPVEGGALQRIALFDDDNVPVHVTNPDILGRIKGSNA